MADFSLDALRDEYKTLYTTHRVRPGRKTEVERMAKTIARGRARYNAVTVGTAPWYAVGIAHAMEMSCNFDCHLHNGDPLSAQTVQVPKGRPPQARFGKVTDFTWEESATDVLEQEHWANVTDWSVTGLCWIFEKWNGAGYRHAGRPPTPYLWSFTTAYAKGKFGSDGHYDPELVSAQAGAIGLLSALQYLNLIDAVPLEAP